MKFSYGILSNISGTVFSTVMAASMLRWKVGVLLLFGTLLAQPKAVQCYTNVALVMKKAYSARFQ